MSKEWLKNFVGMKITSEEMQSIKQPHVELGIHITFKTIQVGTLLFGTSTFLFRLARGPRTGALLRQAFMKGGWVGAGVGAVAGPALTAARTQSMDKEGVYDRCYRLRHNQNQLMIDRLTAISTLLAVATTVPVPMGIAMGIAGGNAVNALKWQ